MLPFAKNIQLYATNRFTIAFGQKQNKFDLDMKARITKEIRGKVLRSYVWEKGLRWGVGEG